MEWFALIVPIVFSLLALAIWKHKLVWWECLLPLVVCIILIASCKHVMIKSLTDDVEFITEYPIEARHYEKWNEYIHRTCTRTYKCGKSTCTSTYDCSYVDTHGKFWEIRTNIGNTYTVGKSYFDFLVNKWGNKTFVDMHRDYHTIDGDMYKSVFDGKFEHVYPQTYEHTYENKTQASKQLFKFRDLDSLETKVLYDYPKVIKMEQDVCLGCSDKENNLLRRYNAILGGKHEVKIFVLFFEDKDISVAELQKSYWKGGNKNELVICVDKDGKWSKTFSWVDDKTIEVESDFIFTQDITMNEKLSKLSEEVKRSWKRKHFSDFEYINVPLTDNQMMWLYIITIIVTFGVLIFGITNDIEHGNGRNIHGGWN